MVISHVMIIPDSALCFNSILGATLGGNGAIFLYNKQNNTWMLGNMKLFLVLTRIALLTHEIFIFLHIHVLFSM